MRKIGDIVYWEYTDGTIGSAKVLGIEEAKDGNHHYIRYNIIVNCIDSIIEDHNCLPEDDPRVQEYIRKQNEGLWIARERSGNLFVFTSKPKLNGIWVRASEPYGSWVQIPSELYPEVTFENSPKKLRI